jgi:NitT/TauT family transport system substrate-binding protein
MSMDKSIWGRAGRAVAALCTAFSITGAAMAASETIRVGVQAAPPDEVYLARPWAEPYGVNVEYTQFSSGGDMLKAFIAGRINVANGGSARIVSLAAKQADQFYIVATHQFGGGRYGLLVAADSQADDVHDLKGKKIGAVTGSGAFSTFRVYLSQHGLTEGDFQIINMKAQDLQSAIHTGIVDAGVAWEPFVAIAETSGVAKRIASMEQVNQSPVFIVVRRDFAEKNPETLVRYLAGVIDASNFMKRNPDESGRIAAEAVNARGVDVDPKALALSFTRFDVGYTVTDELLSELIPIAESMAASGKIESVPDFKNLVRRDYYEQAMELVKSAQ